jgi:small-conductance mechanosensitive channel
MTTELFLNVLLASPTTQASGILDVFGQHPGRRILAILVIAAATHLTVVVVRRLFHAVLRSRPAGHTKFQTLSHFASSVIIFVLYFAAAGMILHEMGVSLTAYIASATVIGFAVSFGAQGLIQDVITSLTVITSDLLNVGDMVDIGGQVGIVERVGIRFTVLVNLSGARVFIPNRNVANVINFERGYIRVFLDARLPQADDKAREALERLRVVSASAYNQFRGLMLREPAVASPRATDAGYSFVRIEFRIWPGQGALVETAIKQTLVLELRAIDPSYADAMVAVHYRALSADEESQMPQQAAAVGRSTRGLPKRKHK